jgi:hypothetical protein
MRVRVQLIRAAHGYRGANSVDIGLGVAQAHQRVIGQGCVGAGQRGKVRPRQGVQNGGHASHLFWMPAGVWWASAAGWVRSKVVMPEN